MKTSPGCAEVYYLAFPHVVAQKRTSNSIRFAFDTNAEMIDCWQIGQRIAAKVRRFIGIHLHSQNNKLTRLGDRKGLPIDRHQSEGSHAIALLADTRDSHLSEAGPRWHLFLSREPRVPIQFCSRVLFENRLERSLPTFAKCWYA